MDIEPISEENDACLYDVDDDDDDDSLFAGGDATRRVRNAPVRRSDVVVR